jgi:hypothetical protein
MGFTRQYKEFEYKATLVKGSPYIIHFSFVYFISLVNHQHIVPAQ